MSFVMPRNSEFEPPEDLPDEDEPGLSKRAANLKGKSNDGICELKQKIFQSHIRVASRGTMGNVSRNATLTAMPSGRLLDTLKLPKESLIDLNNEYFQSTDVFSRTMNTLPKSWNQSKKLD